MNFSPEQSSFNQVEVSGFVMVAILRGLVLGCRAARVWEHGIDSVGMGDDLFNLLRHVGTHDVATAPERRRAGDATSRWCGSAADRLAGATHGCRRCDREQHDDGREQGRHGQFALGQAESAVRGVACLARFPRGFAYNFPDFAILGMYSVCYERSETAAGFSAVDLKES